MPYDDVMQIREEDCSSIRPQKNTTGRNGRRFPWFMAFSSISYETQFRWAHLNYQIGQNNNLEQHKEPEGAPGQGLVKPTKKNINWKKSQAF